MKKPPLVSCIMPTQPERDSLVSLAIRGITKQSYSALEIISERRTSVSIGSTRNAAIRASHGDIIYHADDDDWSSLDRIERCVEVLRSAPGKPGADLVGSSRIYYHEPPTGKAWLYDGAAVTHGPPWIAGGTLVYRRSLWDKLGGFDPWAHQGEDTDFVTRARAAGAVVVDLADPTLYVATVHPQNTCRKQTTGPGWTPVPLETVTKIMGGE
jgi:glycosyltransferase involved in cell wall biosynthesis